MISPKIGSAVSPAGNGIGSSPDGGIASCGGSFGLPAGGNGGGGVLGAGKACGVGPCREIGRAGKPRVASECQRGVPVEFPPAVALEPETMPCCVCGRAEMTGAPCPAEPALTCSRGSTVNGPSPALLTRGNPTMICRDPPGRRAISRGSPVGAVERTLGSDVGIAVGGPVEGALTAPFTAEFLTGTDTGVPATFAGCSPGATEGVIATGVAARTRGALPGTWEAFACPWLSTGRGNSSASLSRRGFTSTAPGVMGCDQRDVGPGVP